jgi:hypothetical protein
MIKTDEDLLRELRLLEMRLMTQKAYISATVVMHAIVRLTQLIIERTGHEHEYKAATRA